MQGFRVLTRLQYIAVFTGTFLALSGCQFIEKAPDATIASYSSSMPIAQGSSVSFAQIDQSVIQPKCVSCHTTGSAAAGVDLSSYAKVMSTGSVVPSSPSRSTFYTTCANGTMPPAGGALSSDLLARISTWISAGAKESSVLTLSSVMPASGPTSGGTVITLSGDGFQGGASVSVGGADCTSLTVISPLQMKCTTPAHAAGNADVTVRNADTHSATLASGFKFVAATSPAPTVASITPATGPVAGGTAVTIRGTGFVVGAGVAFGGAICTNVALVSATELTCTSASRPAAAVDVVVTNPDTQTGTLASGFTYTIEATYSSIYQYLLKPNCLGCHTAGAAAAGVDYSTYVKTLSTGSVVAGSPGTSTAYTTSVAGTMPPSGPAFSAIELKAFSDWIAAGAKSDTGPTLTQVLPVEGPSAGNTAITLTGTRFLQGALVTIGGTACANVMFASATQLTCTTAAHAAGASDVVVTNPDGQSVTLAAGFKYLNPPPTITSVAPVSGSSLGGTLLTVNGTGFLTGATVSLGGSNCTGVSVLSALRLTCTTTAHAAGAVNVMLTNPDLNSTQLALGYTYLGAPTVTLLTPAQGTTAGGTQTILTGTGFQTGAVVTIGGTACTTTTVTSATAIACTTPAHAAGAVEVKVTNTDTQSGALLAGFTYVLVANPAPTLTSVVPATGPLAGGTLVTLNGTNFQAGATVKIGAASCNGLTFVSATRVTCTTGASTVAGPSNVLLTNPDAQAATLSAAYTYTNSPATVTSVAPNTGPAAGGTPLTITGSNFLAGLTVNVGGVACTAINVVSATQVKCNSPAHTIGVVDLVVTNPFAAAATLAAAFTYANPAPTLISVSPTSGPSTGGQVITLAGTGFLAGITVSVGGSACTAITLASSTSLNCTTPAHAIGAVSIVVTNIDTKTATLLNGYTYTAPAPTVASVTPNTGPTAGGTAIAIAGTGFATGAVASVAGVTCTTTTFVSAIRVNCVTAARSTAGTVAVVVTNTDGQSGTLANGFTYTVAPTYSSILLNIFSSKCVQCHGPNLAYKGVDVSTYAKTLSTGSVIAGNPGASTTYKTILDGSMPKGLANLSASETKAVYDWILGGALNN